MTHAFTVAGKQLKEEGESKEADPYLLHPWPIPDDSSNNGHTHGLRAVRAQHANFSHHALDVTRQEVTGCIYACRPVSWDIVREVVLLE